MPQAEPLPQRPWRARGFAPTKPQRAKGAQPLVHYPVEDDEPMSETGLHRKVSIDAGVVLELHHLNRPDAYVGGNCFMYPEEGKHEIVVSPDIFVAYDVPKEPLREVWKVWVEGKAPDFILEVTSKSTRKDDERKKKDLYERHGVKEYWQFDPTGDYLDPILKGRALGADGRYFELELEERNGGLCRFSEVLGLDLRLEDQRLRFFDPKRGEYLPTPDEQQQALEERNGMVELQRRALEERDRTIEERDLALEERDRALGAAQARIRELERQRRPQG